MITMFQQKQQPKQKSFFDRLSGIASIVSAAIICIRLAWMGLISVEWAGHWFIHHYKRSIRAKSVNT